jgi:hypothetical protein
MINTAESTPVSTTGFPATTSVSPMFAKISPLTRLTVLTIAGVTTECVAFVGATCACVEAGAVCGARIDKTGEVTD